MEGDRPEGERRGQGGPTGTTSLMSGFEKHQQLKEAERQVDRWTGGKLWEGGVTGPGAEGSSFAGRPELRRRPPEAWWCLGQSLAQDSWASCHTEALFANEDYDC